MKRIKFSHIECLIAVFLIAIGLPRARVDWQVVGLYALVAMVSAVIGMIEERKGRRREWCGLTVIVLLGLCGKYMQPADWDLWSTLVYSGVFFAVFAVVSLLIGKPSRAKPPEAMAVKRPPSNQS